MDYGYWAWWNDKAQEYRHVYRRRFVVEMCSPDGFKGETERGAGKIVRVRIEVIEDTSDDSVQ